MAYERERILRRAARAARPGRGRRAKRRAVALYRQVAEFEPGNVDLHRKIALLYAKTEQVESSWSSYCRAAALLESAGFLERAIGVHREAATRLPQYVPTWKRLSELELMRGRPVDAVAVLIAGRRKFRSRLTRRAAIVLLTQAYKIDRENLEVALDLALLLARVGTPGKAVALLETFLCGSPETVKRVRARLFRVAPSPARGWHYLRACLGGGSRGRSRNDVARKPPARHGGVSGPTSPQIPPRSG